MLCVELKAKLTGEQGKRSTGRTVKVEAGYWRDWGSGTRYWRAVGLCQLPERHQCVCVCVCVRAFWEYTFTLTSGQLGAVGFASSWPILHTQ